MPISLLTLRTSVRYEIRDPDGVTYDDPHVDYAINQAYRKAFMMVANAIEDYFIDTDTFSFVADQREYALPADHLRTKKVEYVRGDTKVPLFRYRRAVDATSSGNAAGGLNLYPDYDFEAENMIFEPTPQVAVVDAIRHEYYQQCVDLVDDTDEVNAGFKSIWVDVIVLEAAWALHSQLESLGGRVSDDIKNRLTEAKVEMEKTLRVRSLSPRRRRRRGYFQ